MERTGIDPGAIDDVIVGAANQAGEDNRNVGRMAALLAGLPTGVAGQTVNRLCGSGLQAVVSAAHAIAYGDGSVFIAGGVESMTRAPFVMAKPSAAFPRGEQTMYDTTLGWRFTNPRLADAYYPYSMGETAENVVEQCGVSREDQDAFALISQQRWKAANDAGRFADEVIPIEVAEGRETRTFATDEHPRSDATLESLAKLKPAFKRDASGSVTAGNQSGINDGAAAVLVMSESRARELGLKPIARMVASAVAGVDPATMGLGPIPASRRALERAGLSVDDLDLVELNEAFAAQALPVMRELGLDPENDERQRWRDRDRASARGLGRAADGDASPRDAAPRRSVRAGHDVHRRGAGNRRSLRGGRVSEERSISVTAEGEASVAPDLAIVSFAVSGDGKELAPTRDDVNTRSSSVLARLREVGLADADINAPDVSIHPQYDYRKGQRLMGYRVARHMTARVRDLERLGAVLDGVVAAGANEVHGAQMTSSDPSASEHEALRLAVAAARAKAEAIASAAGVAIGSVVRIEEEPDRGPPMPKGRMMAMAESADVPTEVVAGDLTVTRRIRAWFEIT